MTRLIDSSLEKLSTIMSDMGEMAIQCISLATDSYLQGSSNSDKVHDLSDHIRQKYFQVEDLIFDMMLKYQPVAEDFRMIALVRKYHTHILDLVVMHTILRSCARFLATYQTVKIPPYLKFQKK